MGIPLMTPHNWRIIHQQSCQRDGSLASIFKLFTYNWVPMGDCWQALLYLWGSLWAWPNWSIQMVLSCKQNILSAGVNSSSSLYKDSCYDDLFPLQWDKVDFSPSPILRTVFSVTPSPTQWNYGIGVKLYFIQATSAFLVKGLVIFCFSNWLCCQISH